MLLVVSQSVWPGKGTLTNTECSRPHPCPLSTPSQPQGRSDSCKPLGVAWVLVTPASRAARRRPSHPIRSPREVAVSPGGGEGGGGGLPQAHLSGICPLPTQESTTLWEGQGPPSVLVTLSPGKQGSLRWLPWGSFGRDSGADSRRPGARVGSERQGSYWPELLPPPA